MYILEYYYKGFNDTYVYMSTLTKACSERRREEVRTDEERRWVERKG